MGDNDDPKLNYIQDAVIAAIGPSFHMQRGWIVCAVAQLRATTSARVNSEYFCDDTTN